MTENTAAVRVTIAYTLWDRVIDSISDEARRIDPTVNLWRTQWAWTGNRAYIDVPRPVAQYLAGYLESVAGVGTLGTDTEARPEIRRTNAQAAAAAALIRAQLA